MDSFVTRRKEKESVAGSSDPAAADQEMDTEVDVTETVDSQSTETVASGNLNFQVRKKATNQLSRLVEKPMHETESSSSSEGDDKDHDMEDELFQALYEIPRRNEKDRDLFKRFLGEKPSTRTPSPTRL
ncbi:hypothetical protein Hamer_G022202 [Homarus americanus]|uniref:Uncharacterized protein n=1 Tax=Homarus americanus TaxID=6706 RepID=A0A8J5JFX6_HOMAM|nr:hypothetical protein Hamer_G022202 [Homarus americanus]